MMNPGHYRIKTREELFKKYGMPNGRLSLPISISGIEYILGGIIYLENYNGFDSIMIYTDDMGIKNPIPAVIIDGPAETGAAFTCMDSSKYFKLLT